MFMDSIQLHGRRDRNTDSMNLQLWEQYLHLLYSE